jgi:hypothetical protein
MPEAPMMLLLVLVRVGERESKIFRGEKRGGVVWQCLEVEEEEMRAVRYFKNKIKKERGQRKNE